MVRKLYVGASAAAALVVILSVRRRRNRRVAATVEPKSKSHSPDCGLSILVDPSGLTDGWAVAPPLFYPPYYAVVPIIHHTESDAVQQGPLVQDLKHHRDQDDSSECGFFLCDASDVGSMMSLNATTTIDERLARFCSVNPVLAGLSLGSSARLVPLDEESFYTKKASPPTKTEQVNVPDAEATSQTPQARPFSHVVETSSALVYLGTNGMYYHAAVFVHSESEDTAKLQQATQMVLNACALAPLRPTPARADELHAPSAPGAGQGAFHVYFLHKARLLHFTSPPSVRVHHLHSGSDGQACLFKFVVRSALGGGARELPVMTSLLDRIAAAPRSTEGVPLESFLPVEDAASDDSDARRIARTVTITVEEGTRLSEREGLTVLYQQPSVGGFFSIQPGGEVFDPFLSDSPRVWYYPFGVDTNDQQSKNASDHAKPSLSLQRVSPLPATWETTDKTDDAFVHNVIFHLTEWDKQRTACTFTEISGTRCAQFQEEKEGRCCRTYVLPRADSLLLIRWETAQAEWEGMLPTLQFFIDTLHLDA